MWRMTPSLIVIASTVALSVSVLTTSCGQQVPVQKAASSAPAEQPSTGAPWRIAGSSVQGRPIRTLTLGHGARRVLFIGGIHGDEQEGAYTTARLPDAFNNARLGESVTLTIVEDLNPDGRAASTRVNANGVDINRNFPASNFDPREPSSGQAALSQPESRLLVDLISDVMPELVIVVHSWSGKQFVNYDGPAQLVADRFAEESGMPITPSTDFAPTPGSLGSFVGRDRGIPVMTIELLKGSDPKLDWERINSALLNAIAG